MEKLKINITENDIQKQVKKRDGESAKHYANRLAEIKKTLGNKQFQTLLNVDFNFEKQKKLAVQDKSETNEEFQNRVKIIYSSLCKYEAIKNAQESCGQKKQHNLTHSVLRHTRNFFIKTGSAVCAVDFIYGSLIAGIKISYSSPDQSLSETKYHKNKNIEAGYYNKHPLKVCISDEFNSLFEREIKRAVEIFDEKAEGMKFEISIHHLTEESKKDFNIIFKPEKYDEEDNSNNNVLGWSNIAKNDATNLDGTICIDDSKFFLFGVRSTAMHELGHKIGLRHSPDPSSLMYPTSRNFRFSQKDIDNINTMYPAEIEVNQKNSSSKKSSMVYLKNNESINDYLLDKSYEPEF